MYSTYYPIRSFSGLDGWVTVTWSGIPTPNSSNDIIAIYLDNGAFDQSGQDPIVYIYPYLNVRDNPTSQEPTSSVTEVLLKTSLGVTSYTSGNGTYRLVMCTYSL